MSKEAAETQHELLEGEDDRIIVDNSNLSELKCTCDEAVERVCMRLTHS